MRPVGNTSLEKQHGRDVDDTARPLRLDHVPGNSLGQEEARSQIDIDDVIPILLGIVEEIGSTDNAGIVEEVDAASSEDDCLNDPEAILQFSATCVGRVTSVPLETTAR